MRGVDTVATSFYLELPLLNGNRRGTYNVNVLGIPL